MAAPGSTQAITHIVLFKYKPSISWEAFEDHFETFKALQHQCLHPVTQRPYMLSMRMGKNRLAHSSPFLDPHLSCVGMFQNTTLWDP